MTVRFESPPSVNGLRAAIQTTVLCISASACVTYPDATERLNDDVVLTGYSKDTNFKSYQTFALATDIPKAKVNADNSVDTSTVDKAASDEIIGRIGSKLEAAGYRQVAVDAKPDLGVTVAAISTTTVGVVNGAYWGGYYSGYWGYPGASYYYPNSAYYTYTPGSIIVDIVDLTKVTLPSADVDSALKADGGVDRGTLPVVWAMIGYKAFIDDSSSVNTSSADSAIDQAFNQSPYLSRM